MNLGQSFGIHLLFLKDDEMRSVAEMKQHACSTFIFLGTSSMTEEVSKCFKVDWMSSGLLKPLVSSIRLAANSANSSSESYCLVGNEMGTNLANGKE